ncbi:MAG: hypothetical protein R2778_03960 [Saprospiraceae bacterium]
MPVKTTRKASANPDQLQDLVDPDHISIKGARTNNLQNVDLRIPKNQLVVVTGVSGSGKSSITMDTLYAEGQRRYVESLSSYARQFLGRMKKPDVDYIRGICPAIAIEQRVSTGNTRSTVGSMTEIYDFLRLLFARVGKFYSPVSGRIVQKHEVTDVVDFIKNLPDGSRGLVLIPFSKRSKERPIEQELNILLQKGYTRLWKNDEVLRIEDLLDEEKVEVPKDLAQNAYVLMDRFVLPMSEESDWMRLADSVNTAFYESEGECVVQVIDSEGDSKSKTWIFNNRFELDGIVFPEPTPQLFNYNNPYGTCPTCEGYGKVLGIDEDKVVPDKSKSMFDGAIAAWKGEKYGEWLDIFLRNAHHFDFPVHTPYEDLSKEQKKLVWAGNKHFEGINAFFQELESKTYKIQNRVTLARYRGRTVCPTCEGGRLRQEALCVKISDKNISELTGISLEELYTFMQSLDKSLSENDLQIAKRLYWKSITD